MDERVLQFRVGVMVLASLVITAILVVIFGWRPALIQGTYTVYIHFPQAPGVARDTPVRKFGILVGRVSQVDFAEDESGAIVTTQIDVNRKLRTDEICRISNSLLGDAVLEFVDSDEKHLPDTFLQDGDLVRGVVTADPLMVISNLQERLSGAIESVGHTSGEVGLLARRVSDLLEGKDDQIARIVDKTEQTLDRIRRIAESAEEVLGDPQVRENLKQAVADLPEVLAEAREAMGGMKETLSAADRNLANLEGLTRPLGERGEELIGNIESATARLDQLLTQLTTFGDSLNDPRGSLGQLLNNPDLYHQLNSAAANINELTENLKPIVRDARTFTDKISRHPELLGVRGALRPSSGIKRAASELRAPIERETGPGGRLRWQPPDD